MGDKTITVDELLDKFEARQAAKAEAEAKKKAEEEAKKAAEEKKEEKKSYTQDEVMELLEKQSEKFAEKINKGQKIEGDKEETKSEEKENPAFTTSMHINRVKLTKADRMIYDAVKSVSGGRAVELTFPMDLQEGEDRLKWEMQKAQKDGSKADLDGASSYGSDLLPQNWGTALYVRLVALHGNLMSFVPKAPMTAYKHHVSELIPAITVSAYSTYSDQTKAIENVTATSPTTSDLELTAKTFVAKTNVYDRLVDDIKVNLMRGLRRYMSEEFAKKVSSALLNGDTTTTHMDEDHAADSAYIPEKMFKGLRKLIMAGSLGTDGTDAAYTLSDLQSVKTMMGKYALGGQKVNTKWIFGVEAYNKLIGLLYAQTAAPNIADYTLKNGEVDTLFGHQIIISDQQREDLETDGYADSTGTDGNQGFISLQNFSEFIMGIRQEIKIMVIDQPEYRRKQVQADLLLDFAPYETPTTTISSCAGLYGYTN